MSQPFTSVTYRPDIDGLRAVACLSVCMFHAFPSFVPGGFIGVDIFFVISGYLISSIIFSKFNNGTFSFTDFYGRRIRRILPALILILITSIILGWFVLFADEYMQLGKHVFGGATFIQNFILWNEVGYFDNSSATKPLLHLWSLSIEEQFYLLYPCIIFLGLRLNLKVSKIVLSISIVSFLINVIVIEFNLAAAFFLPFGRFWELMLGGVAYQLNNSYGTKYFINHRLFLVISEKLNQINKSVYENIISLLGAYLILSGIILLDGDMIFPGLFALLPVLGSIFIILAGQSAIINKKFLSNHIMVWFGKISYPLYLWHWLLLSFARIVESQTPDRTIRISIIGLSIGLGWITYKFLEVPIRNGKHNGFKTYVLTLLLMVVGYSGACIYFEGGFPYRKSILEIIDNKSQLLRTQERDDECLKYTGAEDLLFDYCRFLNVDGRETVAVIGDSHAHAAYPAIADFFKNKNKNTVLFANSGCPPFLDHPMSGNSLREREGCSRKINQLIETLISKKEIKTVILLTRGTYYVTHTEPLTGDKVLQGLPNSYFDYLLGMQKTIDVLYESGMKIFYVTENPELNYVAQACIERPYRLSKIDCRPNKESVISRQKIYIEQINKLKNVKVISSIDVFCPYQKCMTYYDGKLLYADDDHLSVAGSFFMFDKLLRKYFD